MTKIDKYGKIYISVHNTERGEVLMKHKSTIVYFGSNYEYAKNLATEDTLINFVSENGQCIEFMVHDGELIEVVRDEIEGDAEFLIFEDKYLDKRSEYVYDMTETIKNIILESQENVEELLEKLKNRFNILDNKNIIDKIKSHFERNEDGRQGNFERAEAQRKKSIIALSEMQEYMLSQEEKERILAEKEASYVSHEYKRTTFDDFINSINGKEEIVEILKQRFGDQLREEELLSIRAVDQESFDYIQALLKARQAEHELYAIIAEDFSQEFLKHASLGDLLGVNKSELLRKFVWRMQLTERENKKDSLKES